jgi:hypothetical protein
MTSTPLDLQPGDVIASIGGKANGLDAKRYRFPAPGVEFVEVYRLPKARTRVHLVVRFAERAESATYVLDARYPVQLAPAGTVVPAARVGTLTAEAEARIAARSAARRAERRPDRLVVR